MQDTIESRESRRNFLVKSGLLIRGYRPLGGSRLLGGRKGVESLESLSD